MFIRAQGSLEVIVPCAQVLSNQIPSLEGTFIYNSIAVFCSGRFKYGLNL